MKTIDAAAVKLAALQLIHRNDQTTTLEVKGLLRDLGYGAFQSDVSRLMDQVAEELPLISEPNGQFRTFKLPTPSQAAAVQTASTQTITTVPSSPQTTMIQYISRNGYVVEGSDKAVESTDWVVSSTLIDDVAYFSDENTRDQVRQAFANYYGVPFYTTRSRMNG